MSFLATIGSIVGGYDGIHPLVWNELSFIERVKIYDWKKEGLILGTLLVYLAVYFWGVRTNRQQIKRWMAGVEPVLESEFADVGCSPTQKIIKDTPSSYTTYASGRLNIESVLIRFHAVDRHNAILNSVGIFVPSFRSADGLKDEVLVEITPTNPKAIEPFVFGVVNKGDMQRHRDENYYLSLTRTVDNDTVLPPQFVFMHEHGDTVDALFTPELQVAVKNAGDLLQYFAVTDQAIKAPVKIADLVPVPRVYLSFQYPTNASEEQAVGNVMSAAIRYVDFLVDAKRKRLRPEVTKKILNTRDAELAKLKRVAEERKKEDLEREKAEKKREELKRRGKLSEKEQLKLSKKEQEKLARKQQKKAYRKG